MIAKLFASRLLVGQSQARYGNIQKFLCLHESLNEQVQKESISKFHEAKAKYNLSNTELMHAIGAISLYRLSLAKHNFPERENLLSHQRSLYKRYQDNNYYGLGGTLEETGKILSFRYPDLVDLPNSEKIRALKELEHIFLKNVVERAENQKEVVLKQIVDKAHNIGLQYKKLYGAEMANELNQTLESMVAEYTTNSAYEGLLRTVIDQGLGNQTPTLYVDVMPLDTNQDYEKSIEELTKDYTEEERAYARSVNQSDWASLQNEMVQEARSKGKSQNNFNEKGQKIIYEAEVPNYHVLRFQILAAVFGSYFIYLLYRGDATYKTILLVPAITYGFYFFQKHNAARRALPVVKQILRGQNQDLEFLIERNRIISRIENVAATNFKIQRSSRKFFDFQLGLVSQDGQVCTINDQAAILPYQYVGNAKDLM